LLARMSVTLDDITTRTLEAHQFCTEWFNRLGHQGPFTPFGMAPSLLMPGPNLSGDVDRDAH
jgi:hypothetical protein